jgi:magnesium-transporting ATPase (P-type)
MYVERDAKIILIYHAIVGIITFVSLYIGVSFIQQRYPNENFALFQLIVFSVIFILILIVICTSYALKKEISMQQKYLLELQKGTSKIEEKIVKIPYNKSGLYLLIIVSIIGILIFVYFFNFMVLEQHPEIRIEKETITTLSMLILSIIILLSSILLVSLKILLKRIEVPLCNEYKSCPRCGSSEIHKVEYSWWGGLLGPALVHQVRCKKCGKTYDGSTGRNITRPITIYMLVGFFIIIILSLLKYFL